MKGKKIIMALIIAFTMGLCSFAFSLPTLPQTTYTAYAAVLKQGSSGTDVKTMQQKLKNWGYYTGAVDGVFGAKLAEKPQKGGAFNYKTGQRIRHKTFGDGTVAELTPMGNDVMLRVIFDTCGEKLMMGKSASAHITAL